MNEHIEVPEWLNKMVLKRKQSQLTLSVDSLGRLELSDSLKSFLVDILNCTSGDRFQPSNAHFLEQIKMFSPHKIEEITSVVEVAINPPMPVHQTVQHQYQIFLQPPPADVQVRSSPNAAVVSAASFFAPPPPEQKVVTMPPPEARNPSPLFNFQGATLEVQSFSVTAPKDAQVLKATEGSVVKVQSLNAVIK